MTGGSGVDRRELGEATSHGQLYLDRLRVAHLTLSGVALLAFGGLVGALPLVALAWPGIGSRTFQGIPLGVLLLLAPYPVFVAIGAVYTRRADGLDETFAALVDEDDVREPGPAPKGDGGVPGTDGDDGGVPRTDEDDGGVGGTDGDDGGVRRTDGDHGAARETGGSAGGAHLPRGSRTGRAP